jgi:glycosyltransferase involved in cell wall biosynthesis
MRNATFLHLAANSASNASRILKESFSLVNSGLASSGEVLAIAGVSAPTVDLVAERVQIRRLPQPLHWLPRSPVFGAVKAIAFSLKAIREILASKPDLIIAHGVLTLPSSVIAGLLTRRPVIYDCHELERRTLGTSKGLWRVYAYWAEKIFLRHAAAVIVVNDTIADWYKKEYGQRPHVIKAYPDPRWQETGGDSYSFRAAFGIPDEAIIFLYQGALLPGRRLTQVLDVFVGAAEDRHLVVMGYGELESAVREATRKCKRIHFLPAVPPQDVFKYSRGADVGIVGMEAVSLSNYYSLPNKLLEYIHAGLAVIGPDFPEIASLINAADCGWIHQEGTENLLALVNSLSRNDIATMAAGAVAIRDSLTWSTQEPVLLRIAAEALRHRG